MASDVRILIVEDDPYLGLIIKDFFESRDFHVSYCSNAEEGIKIFRQNHFDICLFDVILPKHDGFYLAEEVRKYNSNIPIIFLTAQTMKEDVIKGFKVGADDYIKKPFVMDELLLRVNAVLRRTNSKVQAKNEIEEYEIGKYKFNYKYQKLTSEDSLQKLTHKENELLKLFCDNKNEVLDRKVVLQDLWGDDSIFNARSMDVYIAKLRKYFKLDSSIEIVNVRGKGYKMRIS